MHNVENGETYFKNMYSVHTARHLKYIWPFFIIMHEKVNQKVSQFLLTEVQTAQSKILVKGP